MSCLPHRLNTWDAVGTLKSILNKLFVIWLISMTNLMVHRDLMPTGLLVL